MFRRRRLFQPNLLSPDQLAILVHANQLMSQGKPLEAGPLFTRVADTMQATGRPRRAANLYARAAHAFADGNQARGCLANARNALALFNQTNMHARLATFYSHITRKMANHGMQSAVEALHQEFGTRLTDLPTKPISMPPLRRGLLPTSCPKCGAPVHTEDATWVDENTVECEYCGALIRSE